MMEIPVPGNKGIAYQYARDSIGWWYGQSCSNDTLVRAYWVRDLDAAVRFLTLEGLWAIREGHYIVVARTPEDSIANPFRDAIIRENEIMSQDIQLVKLNTIRLGYVRNGMLWSGWLDMFKIIEKPKSDTWFPWKVLEDVEDRDSS